MSRLGKKRRRWWIPVLILFLLLGAAAAVFFSYIQRMSREQGVFTWKEGNRTILNPARGMYMQLYHDATSDWMGKNQSEGRTLTLITMDLQKYTGKKIPGTELHHLEELLKGARENGVMVFFRASYKQKEKMEEPSLKQIHKHISQLSTLLNEYGDVVLMVQAGMIGLWGEWHSSDYLRDEKAVMKEAGQVVRWWLEELDAHILLNLRRPSYIQLMEKAGMDTSRIGFHNDGLLGSEDDLGTYPDRETDLKWCQEHINGRFNGGEMPYKNDLTDPSNAIEEFDRIALSYLNVYYNTEVLDDWKTREYFGENAYDYIERHLGYRYYVKKAEAQKYVFEYQNQIHLAFELENTGFSSIVSRFRPYLVVEQEGERQFIPVSDQLREKGLERYAADIRLSGFSPVKIGICYTDASDPQTALKSTEGAGKKNAASAGLYGQSGGKAFHCVEMAGEKNIYQNGVNYILEYRMDPKTKKYMTVSDLQK